MKYNFVIVITTFNRIDNLKRLVNQIIDNTKDKIIKIIIIDDGTEENYSFSSKEIQLIKITPNNGKKKFYKNIDLAFKILKKIKAEYYFFLQDDIILKENFFMKSIKLYEEIQDENKIVLSTLMCESQRGKAKWSNFIPILQGDVYLCQWCELFFITKYNFFEILNFEIHKIDEKIWDKNPLYGSGVGQQITTRLLNLKKNMYVVKNSLCITDNSISLMNPDERKINPLIAI